MLSLTSANHNSTLMNTFTDYFEKGNYFDLTFVCGDNVKVKAHKMIIGTVSNFLKDMVSSEDGEVYINLPDVKSSDMKLLLKFLYGGTANVSQGELYRLKDVIFVLGINISNTVIRKTETVATSENSGVSLKQKENKKSRSVKRLPPITNIFQAAPQNVSDDPLDTPDIYDAPDVEDRVQPVVESIFSASSSFVPHAEASISASSSSFEEVVVKKEEIDPELSLEDSLLDADMGMFHQDHGSSTRKPKKRLLEPVITSVEGYFGHFNIPIAKKCYYTAHMRNVLEDEYQRNQFPDASKCGQLAAELGIPANRIKKWFNNRRQKERFKTETGDISISFSPEQIIVLEQEYEKDQHPGVRRQKELGDMFGVSLTVIATWFANRRSLARTFE